MPRNQRLYPVLLGNVQGQTRIRPCRRMVATELRQSCGDALNVLRSKKAHHSASKPLRDSRSDGVSDRVVAQTIHPSGNNASATLKVGPAIRESLCPLNFQWRETAHTAIGVPNIIARPVSSCMPRRLRIDAVGNAFYERPPDRISNDFLKEGGRFLFIWSTLLIMPIAAFRLKKYFSGISPVSMHGNNEDAAALLGDSKVFAVKHTPCDTIPEFIQRLEYDGEVSSSVAREKAMHVFEHNCCWTTRSNEPHKLKKEPRLVPSKPRARPHSGQREVLAWKSCRPYI